MVGAGKVAGHLARALQGAGHNITALYNRSAAKGAALQQQLAGTQLLDQPNFLGVNVQVIIIAVADGAIGTVAKQLQRRTGTLLAHTSGTAPLAALNGSSDYPTGVLYPLQTFSAGTVPNMAAVPFCLEAQQPAHMALLQQMVHSMGARWWAIDSHARQQLHVAAVMACNFTNHLLHVAQQHLKQHCIDPALLQPLIQETIQKSMAISPFAAQTGPALRGDVNTMVKHLNILQNDPLLQQIYKDISMHIGSQHGTPFNLD